MAILATFEATLEFWFCGFLRSFLRKLQAEEMMMHHRLWIGFRTLKIACGFLTMLRCLEVQMTRITTRREETRKKNQQFNYCPSHCSKSSFFVQKINFDFPLKLSIFWVKNSWKCCGFGLFSCWQLWFHEKNCQKKNWAKNSWKCSGFVKIELLVKNLTFRIVCG